MALKFQSLIIIWWSSQELVPVMAWNLPYFYLRGFPKKGCHFWHGIFPKNVPVMACFCPLFIFIWWFPQKNVCQLWHGNLFPYIYLGVDPFTYLYLGFYPQQPQPKTHLPTHPFFPKNTAALAPAAGVKNEAFAGQGCQAQQQKHHGHS